jgi:hypothetical protein
VEDLKLLRVLLFSLILGAMLLAAAQPRCDQASALEDSGAPCPDCRLVPSKGYYSPFVAVAGALIQLLQIRALRRSKKEELPASE